MTIDEIILKRKVKQMTIDEIIDRITTQDYTFSWEELIESLNEEEVKVMREYYRNSGIPMKFVDVDLKENCVYAYMRLMAVECLIDDEIINSALIVDYLIENGFR